MLCTDCKDTACIHRGRLPPCTGTCSGLKPYDYKIMLEASKPGKAYIKELLEELPLEKGMPAPKEDQEQIWLFQWAERNIDKYPDLFWMYHNANGGKRTKAEAGIFRAMGVKRGVPDIFLPAARCGRHGLYLELKRMTDSKTTEDQRKWRAGLEAQGYRSVIRLGWRAGANAIIKYLNNDLEADE